MKRNIFKRLLGVALVFLLSINSFAAVVSDNDGSAFITKAEFDSLKNNFQNQIDQYNSSIDSKIDGAIASYLAGIKVSQAQQINLSAENFDGLRFQRRLYTVCSGGDNFTGAFIGLNDACDHFEEVHDGDALVSSLYGQGITDHIQAVSNNTNYMDVGHIDFLNNAHTRSTSTTYTATCAVGTLVQNCPSCKIARDMAVGIIDPTRFNRAKTWTFQPAQVALTVTSRFTVTSIQLVRHMVLCRGPHLIYVKATI